MSLVEGRRLSWPRLGIVLVAAGAIVFASLQGWRGFQDARADIPQESWFAPYVDVTATPTIQFEEAPSGAGPNTVLAFVVADPENPCDPSWGGAYTMDEASEQLDLDRRIARVRQLGGTPIVAFGGQANTELAVACSDGEELYDAYRSVVTRYGAQVIDLDVEGESLLDASANDRRAEALARLQTEQDLSIWVTLPVSPDGLTQDGERLVAAMLAAGVDLAGVNAMTMNYGESKDANQSMAAASIEALESTHKQVAQLYDDSGRHLTSAQVWRRIGATPMLGQNDIAGEVFGLRDAEQLHEFASENRLGRISMWSLNRDRACSGNYPDVSIVSDSCSGVDQAESAFSATLGTALDGAPATDTTTSTAVDPTTTPTDDPEASPYPIWTEDEAYQAGDRVVWRQNVYAAKWWTSGELPDDPTIDESASAWTLIGPVLPGETPEPTPTVPAGTYPEWLPDVAYDKGDRVRFEKIAYVALWWTQGDPPDGPSTADAPSPWRLLTAVEIESPTETPAG
jgi:chitinase